MANIFYSIIDEDFSKLKGVVGIDKIAQKYLKEAHLQNPDSVKFHTEFYFQSIRATDEPFFKFYTDSPDFFAQIKSRYKISGLDLKYLSMLEADKLDMLALAENKKNKQLYDEKFKKAELTKKNKIVNTEQSCFYADVMHTLNPVDYSPINNPVMAYFKHRSGDAANIFVKFFYDYNRYCEGLKEWCNEETNRPLLDKIRRKFIELDTENVMQHDKITDLKLIDLIYWGKTYLEKLEK